MYNEYYTLHIINNVRFKHFLIENKIMLRVDLFLMLRQNDQIKKWFKFILKVDII
jgi:hypothetical protein